ncbi:adenylate/guanylate cyclase domain-containing protein [Acidovorax sp. 210-6]|uniref:CHASE2 domain-containing protein n=1 Tax=Acidovorax sp. 210-6 TaxID=2699468 RepID=UPI00138A6359|nr:adenylate/guanylate cyclase domain-containing protein [Acidovorax sp. 210-6]NCU64344.1 adenylate/guanylate cyclase domain-containing protein [Acidovorax sp. 210-6]
MTHQAPSVKARSWGAALRRRGLRLLVAFLPMLLALLHASGAWRMPVLDRLDQIIYDIRLRATMPRTLDERVMIVDIDERSLEEVGHWPWGRDKLAQLTQELLERQQAAVLGFDVVFSEPDGSSGLRHLQHLAQGALRDVPGYGQALQKLAPELDFDQRFAEVLRGQSVVLGYYFTSDRDGGARGQLPQPVVTRQQLMGQALRATAWNGHGSNIPSLAQAAPVAGFFNAMSDVDGVVRSLPLLAQYQGQYYESLALAVFRTLLGLPEVRPSFAAGGTQEWAAVQGIELHQDGRSQLIPTDDRLAVLVPYRGPGGQRGGSFSYVSASDVLRGKLPAAQLRDKVVLVGSTAPGLQDLRATPVGGAYPGVEAHANLIARFLDGQGPVQPDYALGFDLAQIAIAGLLLGLLLPWMGAGLALALSVSVFAALVGLNLWLFLSHSLVFPLATVLVMVLLAFALNMSYGYFVESRTKRGLAHLFGTYVPPELVDEMVREPERYSMQAAMRELTVMFCDIRGFTTLSERMEPVQLQALLNTLFSRLTHVIRQQRGTIDKYMGDCVMAFWGAPVTAPDHAHLAVQAALDMVQAVHAVNTEHQAQGLPAIGVGVGLNTGPMCVGDMGSDVRRSYTVIGDAVNLGSRLEGLCKAYGVEIVASESTRAQAPGFVWQELDRVRVKGKEQAVAIYRPLGPRDAIGAAEHEALERWHSWLAAFRAQDWLRCDALWPLLPTGPGWDGLRSFYAQRIQERRVLPYDPGWDAATQFDTK